MPKHETDADIDVGQLRAEQYNATVVAIRHCHDELMVMRVRPDFEVPSFLPGQYTVLGLGYWEPRAPGCQAEQDVNHLRQHLIKRAYSISFPILNAAADQVESAELDFMEFFIALVRKGPRPPALTPRIFSLNVGDRIFCGPHIHGRYTLDHVPPDTNVVFAATGTGEAPHNAMVAELVRRGHRGRIVNITCSRWKSDLGYLAEHRRLEQLFPRYQYVPLTTREPENLDATHPDFVGKRYLQDYFDSGDFTEETGLSLVPQDMQIFLCGNPEMIGAPTRSRDVDHRRRFPQPKRMVETLEERGFHADQPRLPGNIHFELYW